MQSQLLTRRVLSVLKTSENYDERKEIKKTPALGTGVLYRSGITLLFAY